MDGGVQKKSLVLSIAQKALAPSNSKILQAIIPMMGSIAGDPHKLSKSWTGGSMFWNGWDHINSMRKMCSLEEPPEAGMHSNLE